MHRFRRIVACTDFSELGDRAVAMAFGLCIGSDCEVTLVHVVDMPAPPNPLYAHYMAAEALDHTTLQEVQNKAREALEAKIPAEAKSQGVSVKFVLPQGDAAEEIVQAAEAAQAEVIVMGTRGRRDLERLLLGSVTERVLRTSKCAVLVTH